MRSIVEGDERTMTVAETLSGMQKLFNPAAAKGINKTIQLNITGEDAGVYTIKIENQTCQLIPGGVENPNLTLTTSDKDWIAITQGKQDAMQAFLTGKVKATGDLMFAMNITNLFKIK
jgi:putative sterol carrier protein